MIGRQGIVRALVVLAMLCHAALALAQNQVRVNEDRTTIWQPGFQVVADVVNAGTTLTVVAKRGNFYEVELLRPAGAGVRTGFVAVSRVTALDGNALRVPERPPSGGGSRQPFGPRSRSRGQAASRTPAHLMFRAFGQVGYGRFNAAQTFNAVMGRSGAPWFGGGIQIGSSRGMFVEVAVDRYQDTGRRVFVFEDEVFDLGSDTTVRIVPVTVSLGYRFWQQRNVSIYASAGVGAAMYRETSPAANDDEDVQERFATYQAVLGAEVSVASKLATAFEVQYSTTPDAITTGVGSLYDERNLGALQLRVKLLFGR